ncbi:hypothetical protein PsalMR5_01186 [Piscirickettsia salmonis]|uniref:nucleotidyl transferase AbiEii/AbiGii toxin family protein n=1 Tax=Piscirickettsia salmonis TaxID=1238 RepID=UPI0012BA9E56|nr:nucleotidyl transferase AbiEii/AbiGii toxin family protein [Piscirickettsia salmonis]QGP63331.1 hypothetical protein PsalMR5_01186 [Piscirickettsia salmonis]
MLDITLLPDIADALSVSIDIIEKDYYVTQSLKLLTTIESDCFTLVFAGGTCLSKAYAATNRMSEDVDIKIVPKPLFNELSLGKKRQQRRELSNEIVNLVNRSGILKVSQGGVSRRSEGQNQNYQINYNKHNKQTVSVLRPNVLLEITESQLYQPSIIKPLSSFYAQALDQSAEVLGFHCVALESTIAEKMIALLRKLALSKTNGTQFDGRLVRHVHDTAMTIDLICFDKVKELFPKIVAGDIERYGNRHSEFRADYREVMQEGFKLLTDKKHGHDNYLSYIHPLVFKGETCWEDDLSKFQSIVYHVLDLS